MRASLQAVVSATDISTLNDNTAYAEAVNVKNKSSAEGKERGDIEMKDYVVLQNPQEQANRLPPPRTLILDFTLLDNLTYSHKAFRWCS